MKFVFSRLTRDHKRNVFHCGESLLDTYLQKYAGQDAKKGYATVIVASPEADPEKIFGYYTLAAASVVLDRLPQETIHTLPKYGDVPAILLGRLAVATEQQGQRLGSYLLFDALRRCLRSELAWALFLVHAKNDQSRNFYSRFQFKSFTDNALHLWLHRKQVACLVK